MVALQLCFYSELVEAIQGIPPARMRVVLGTRESRAFRVADFAAYYRSVKRGFEAVVDAGPSSTYPEPVEHCAVCRWQEHCAARREADDHLSLVARIQRSQRSRLTERGIATVTQLAATEPADRPKRIGAGAFATLRAHARLTLSQRASGEPRYELQAPEDGCGFARLPRPSAGDLFFDIEGDPFFDNGLEYLFGCVSLNINNNRKKSRDRESQHGQSQFQAFWATDRSSEKRAFEGFVDFAIERLERYPDMHIYHYAPYEASAIKRLMGLHGTREEVDRLLRGEVLVDLYAVVRQGVRVGQPNYSIKSIEAFYMGRRDTDVADGGDSIVAFERFLETGDRALLESIERYNEDDCRSTQLLREWLLARREEAVETFGLEIPWKPAPAAREPDRESQDELDQLQGVLLAGAPDDGADRDDAKRASWLMAQLLDYHRREAKPAWWRYFERLEADEEQLTEVDTEALGSIAPVAEIEPIPLPAPSQSLIHTLHFPPQDHKIRAGGFVDPASRRGVTVESIDNAAGTLRISRAAKRSGEPLPRALIPGGPYDTRVQRAALRRFAEDIVERGFDAGGRYGALRQILRRAFPPSSARTRGAALQAGAFDLEDAKRIAEGLDDSYLFIQGPPGSGKTYTGARLILDLIARGHRVGVAGSSHAAIHNLLAEVERHAPPGEPFAGLKRCGSDGSNSYESERGLIESSNEIADFTGGDHNLVAGTAWLFCREELDGTLDYLFLDLGYLGLPDGAAELVFQVISERNERASLIVTTNLPFGEWTKVFPDARLAKAVVDRITHRAHIIETGTESWRFRHGIQQKDKGAPR